MAIERKTLIEIANIIKKSGNGFDKITPRLLATPVLFESIAEFVEDSKDRAFSIFADTEYLDIINKFIAENQDVQQPDALDEEGKPIDLMSRKAIELAVADLNEVMGLDPGIDLSLDDDALLKAFGKAAKLANEDDDFTDYTFRVLAAHGFVLRPVKAPEKKQSVQKKPVKKGPSPKAAAKPAKQDKRQKAPGVISTIADFVRDVYQSDNQVIDPLPLLARLIEAFPNRPKLSLMNTINTQIPGKLSKERGFVFEKVENGDLKVVKVSEG